MGQSRYTGNMDATNDEPILLTVSDAAHLCSISTKHMYRVLRDGTIPSVKLGKRVLVPRRALEALGNGPIAQHTDNPADMLRLITTGSPPD